MCTTCQDQCDKFDLDLALRAALLNSHYSNVIMSAMAFQITGVSMVCSAVYSGADQRKKQSSASPAFVRGIHRWPMNSPHKGQWRGGQWCSQRTSDAENVSIWWRHHALQPSSYMGPELGARRCWAISGYSDYELKHVLFKMSPLINDYDNILVNQSSRVDETVHRHQ